MIAFLTSDKARSLGLLLLRLVVGYTMFYHGAQKLFGWFGGGGMEGFTGYIKSLGLPLPAANAYAAAIAEFLGGILLALGVVFRPAALAVFFTMMVAVFSAHWSNGFGGKGGYEYPLNLGIAALALALIGAGCYRFKTPLKFDV